MKNNTKAPKHTPGQYTKENEAAKEFYDDCEGQIAYNLSKLKQVNQSSLKPIVIDSSKESKSKK